MKNKLMLSYLAGFFDGEGSINILKRLRKNFSPEHTLTVAIGQRDGETLDWVKDSFGGNIHLVKRDNSYFWYCSNKKALDFLKEVLPFLRYKKPQAELAVRFYSERSDKRSKPVPKDEIQRRERIRDEMIALHKTFIASRYAGSTTKRADPKGM